VNALVAPERASTALEPHLRRLLDKHLRKLRKALRYDAATSAADAIHDLRVATRRARAFTDVVTLGSGAKAGRRFERRLRRVGRAVSDLRNTDVAIALVERKLATATFDADRAALEHLLERLARARRRAQRRASKRLDCVAPDVLCSRTRADFETAMREIDRAGVALPAVAAGWVERRVANALGRRPARDGLEHEEELHRLRIAVKKLRYTLELFGSVMNDRGRELYEPARGLQELLGEHHDLMVLTDLVEREVAKLQAHGRLTLARSLHGLLADLRSERSRLVARFAHHRLPAGRAASTA
jgi:triphosphatase